MLKTRLAKFSFTPCNYVPLHNFPFSPKSPPSPMMRGGRKRGVLLRQGDFHLSYKHHYMIN